MINETYPNNSLFIQGTELIYKSLFTILIAIIGTVLIFITKKIIEEDYIKPYFSLRKNLIELKIFLNFNSNILTNKFDNEEISDEFRESIHNIKKELRKIWSRLNVNYDICPKKVLFWEIKIPKGDEMEKIETTLIYLSNAPLIRYEHIEENGDDILSRVKKFDNIIKIMNKYLKSK